MPPAHFIFGDDGHGRRYYVDVIPEGMELVHEGRAEYKRGPPSLHMTAIERESGSQNFQTTLERSANTLVSRIVLLRDVREMPGSQAETRDVRGEDEPILKSFNEMYRNGKLLYMQFHENDKPASNALYYGFNKDGFDIQISTDGKGMIKSVVKNDPRKADYDGLVYVMYGKAMMDVILFNNDEALYIETEQVDKAKFKGRETFAESRMPMMRGEVLDENQLSTLLNLEDTEPARSPKTSSVVNFLSSKFGFGKKRQYRRVGSHSSSEDDEQESLLGE
ncbi:hypothetical protein FOL47_004021 [Perkinsus chesapeaki]|uniref:Uncharacterized protein n=1 Tax=Perkinsus chesapeaki TaxID=330153 RepID=A0A7J6M568_PERCH|nr:hypothetical protein FOL47_004021 [Perkinsus chesapeaki]